MYTKVKLKCVDQTLLPVSLPKLASGGRKSVQVEFTFDSLWDGFGKTAIFYRNKNSVHHEVLTDDACKAPWHMIFDPGVVYVGVYGSSGGVVRTSEVLALTIEQGAITGASAMEPTPDVYQQVLAAYGEAERAIAAETQARKAEIAVERARIDNFISGDPADNAEVQDIRVGYDGRTYGTAGEAVRGQAKDMDETMARSLNSEMLRAWSSSVEVGMRWNYVQNSPLTSSAVSDNVRARLPIVRNWLPTKIAVASGYQMTVIRLDPSLVCTGETGWITATTIIEAGVSFAICLSKIDGSAFDPALAADILTAELVHPEIGPLQEWTVSAESRIVAMECLVDDVTLQNTIAAAVVPGTAWNFTVGAAPNRHTRSDGIRASVDIMRYGKPVKIVVTSGHTISVLFLDRSGLCVSETGWTAGIVMVPANQTFAINVRRTNDSSMTLEDVLNAFTAEITEPPADEVLRSTMIEYGRLHGASYTYLRIPYTSITGRPIRPVLALTSPDGSLDGEKRSPLRYAQENDTEVTINAGLFNVTSYQPVGQTIIGGVNVVDTPMADDNGYPISAGECYPLCVDADGIMSAPYERSVSTANMLEDGVVQAVTGWGKLVENFAICSADIEAEIVHPGTYIRQCIGQFQNGDYCVLTVDQSRGKVENEAGLSYEDCAQILVDKGVKFAYSLDGGGSAATILGKRQLNPIYEGTMGRAVPTVITFKAM